MTIQHRNIHVDDPCYLSPPLDHASLLLRLFLPLPLPACNVDTRSDATRIIKQALALIIKLKTNIHCSLFCAWTPNVQHPSPHVASKRTTHNPPEELPGEATLSRC